MLAAQTPATRRSSVCVSPAGACSSAERILGSTVARPIYAILHTRQPMLSILRMANRLGRWRFTKTSAALYSLCSVVITDSPGSRRARVFVHSVLGPTLFPPRLFFGGG